MGNQVFAACKSGNLQELRSLIVSGRFDVNSKVHGATALQWACHYKRVEVIELLLELQANVHAVGENGNTPLHTAAMENVYEVMLILLNAGANVHARNNDGITPIHILCQYSNTEAFDLLISRGATILVKDNLGNTPLHVACTMHRVEIFSPLLKLGADLEARTNDGSSPLHYACRHNRLTAIQFLLANGADINQVNDIKQTPLHDACSHGRIESAHLLIAYGADTKVVDIYGKVASQYSSFETSKALNIILAEWSARSAEFSNEINDIMNFLKRFGIPAEMASFYAQQIVIKYKLDTSKKLRDISSNNPSEIRSIFRSMGIDEIIATKVVNSLGGSCVVS